MTEDQIIAEIDRQIRKLVPDLDEPITADTNFEDIGMDSLTRVDLLAAVEGVFDLDVPDESVAGLIHVRDLAELVLSMQPAAAA